MGFTSSVQLARAEPRSGSVIPAFVVLNDGRGLYCRKEKWFADESGIDVWCRPMRKSREGSAWIASETSLFIKRTGKPCGNIGTFCENVF
jgi:hypothetical protein